MIKTGKIAENSAFAAEIGFSDLFKIGIGPSSSHTVGPMRAAGMFLSALGESIPDVTRIRIVLYGSLAWTGRGHGTDKAIVLGLEGELPETTATENSDRRFSKICGSGRLCLAAEHSILFDLTEDLVFDRDRRDARHPNTLDITAFSRSGAVIGCERYYSVGGGFVETNTTSCSQNPTSGYVLPHPYRTMAEMLDLAANQNLTIAELFRSNELAHQSAPVLEKYINLIATTMLGSIQCGLKTDGTLAGGLKVKRRAAKLYRELQVTAKSNVSLPPDNALRFVSAYAIAVNEENAAGGRIVTAPTNGAAGVVPAVYRYMLDHCGGDAQHKSETFFLTAAAIGGIIKFNASISGAEVGCQGEVGSASAMAAAGLAAGLGASNAQIENAAEIALEHHLGMTCDPIGGLVQIPCIERNAFGAIKAVSAASLAMQGDGTHIVHLDQVIETMRQTGQDMSEKYRETSRGGLAVNVPEC